MIRNFAKKKAMTTTFFNKCFKVFVKTSRGYFPVTAARLLAQYPIEYSLLSDGVYNHDYSKHSLRDVYRVRTRPTCTYDKYVIVNCYNGSTIYAYSI